ncbi:hypothetical protein PR048_015774 [Dryococelus australis]|uniref:Uncharacterized protein n=1 Tax=Dryococelus australis TaxID=614101 RepID=A0ABQ9HHV6_9NEOP|nr:hypothetical protein PR048_015774 [Dryococelus australis]
MLHVHALCHRPLLTLKFLAGNHMVVFSYPSYSPVLASADFALSPKRSPFRYHCGYPVIQCESQNVLTYFEKKTSRTYPRSGRNAGSSILTIYSALTETAPRRVSFRPAPVSQPQPEQTRDRDSHESVRAIRRRRARTQLTSLSAGLLWHPTVEWPRPRTRRPPALSLSFSFNLSIVQDIEVPLLDTQAFVSRLPFVLLSSISDLVFLLLFLAASPTKANRIQSPAGSLRIFASGNLAGRCRWSAGFLGDILFLPPFHSSAVPFSLHFTLIGFLDLAVKSRPNLFTHSQSNQQNHFNTAESDFRVAGTRPLLHALLSEAAQRNTHRETQFRFQARHGHPDLDFSTWLYHTTPPRWLQSAWHTYAHAPALPATPSTDTLPRNHDNNADDRSEAQSQRTSRVACGRRESATADLLDASGAQARGRREIEGSVEGIFSPLDAIVVCRHKMFSGSHCGLAEHVAADDNVPRDHNCFFLFSSATERSVVDGSGAVYEEQGGGAQNWAESAARLSVSPPAHPLLTGVSASRTATHLRVSRGWADADWSTTQPGPKLAVSLSKHLLVDLRTIGVPLRNIGRGLMWVGVHMPSCSQITHSWGAMVKTTASNTNCRKAKGRMNVCYIIKNIPLKTIKPSMTYPGSEPSTSSSGNTLAVLSTVMA